MSFENSRETWTARRGAAALGLAALASLPAAAEDKPISIAFVSGPLNDSFFPPLYQGAQDAAKALGVKLNYIPIDEADIEATSARTMQAAIAQKPDAIVVGDFITSVVDPYIKQAVAAGIPVYVNQSGQDQWQADGAFGFVGQQGPEVGRVAAERLAKAGSKNILCVINVPGNPYLQAICKGLAEQGQGARRHVRAISNCRPPIRPTRPRSAATSAPICSPTRTSTASSPRTPPSERRRPPRSTPRSLRARSMSARWRSRGSRCSRSRTARSSSSSTSSPISTAISA